MVELTSGIEKVDNLSGGVFRSATPNTIPSVSFSDIANFDIENSEIKTRRGLTKYGTNLRPGCLQFGFSDTQRVHYLRTRNAEYMGATATTIALNCFFYARDLTSTTQDRTLLSFSTSRSTLTGNPLAEVYWGNDDKMKFRFRETASDSWKEVGGTATRATQTNYLYGIRIERTGTTCVTSLYDSSGLVNTTTNTVALTFTTWSGMVIGSDTNFINPGFSYTNAANKALYGYMGEVCLTKNISPTATTYATNYQVLPPAYHTQDANKVAYYPLRTNYDDAWGLEPSFSPSGIYRSGAGLTNYLVRDNNIPGLAKNPLYCTKSWHVERFNGDISLGAQTNSGLGDSYVNAISGRGGSYTITMDILPIKSEGTTDKATVFGGDEGPLITLEESSTSGFTKLSYKHDFNSANSTTLTTELENKKQSRVTFQYVHSATTQEYEMKLYKDMSLVSSTITTLTGSTTPDAATVLRMNTEIDTNYANYKLDYYVSGIILHNAAVGTSWSEKPSEKITNSTIYETSRVRRVFFDNSSMSFEVRSSETTTATNKIEDTGQTQKFNSVMDLPKIDNVIGGWLFNEVTGFDTATTSTPHGIIRNIFSTSTTDNSDLLLRYNSTPIWHADRAPLVTTGFLDDVYDKEPDRLAAFTPNDSTSRDTLVIRNNTLTSYTGTTYVLGDTYKYTGRLDTQLRPFMYGQSMYLHGEDYKLRFKGSAIVPADSPAPSYRLSLTATTQSSGLRGYYLYSYTFVDKNGIESYPALPIGTTVNTGKVTVTCPLSIYDQSWISDCVEKVRFYRSKGTTTNTTSLTIDASPELYLLREQALDTIKNNVGATWFEDTTADDALGAGAPLPGFADIMPSCKYATTYNDVAYFTGNTFEPTMVYKSMAEKPFLITQAEEFRTEDGEKIEGIASVGGGIVIFKRSSRKYYHRGMGTERPYEYDNGGCIAHDSLVSMGSEVMGLGEHGFFVTDGHRYRDVSTIIQGDRAVSSVQYDIDQLDEATKRAATAIYHSPTSRYICKLNNTLYVFEKKRQRWLIYRDVLGEMLVQGGSLYMYLNGSFYKEVSNIGYVGGGAYTGTFSSGGIGKINVTDASTLPTTNEEGLPIYIDKTKYDVVRIEGSANDYTITIDTNETFSSGAYALGVIRHYADTKFYEERTPGRNKLYMGTMTLEHSNTTNGTINLRTARNGGSFDDTWNHFEFDTNEDKGTCILRERGESLALRFEIMDGKQHELRSYTFPYKQDSIT